MRSFGYASGPGYRQTRSVRLTPPATRWCHVTWSTAGHHKFLNIAALARFCERALSDECTRHGWRGEAAVLPDRIHVLVEVPATVTREALIHIVRRAATSLVRETGAVAPAQRVWEENCWCSVVTNGTAVEAIRRRLRAINTPAATSPP
jgi:REP element-mobilizing transposase RayT